MSKQAEGRIANAVTDAEQFKKQNFSDGKCMSKKAEGRIANAVADAEQFKKQN